MLIVALPDLRIKSASISGASDWLRAQPDFVAEAAPAGENGKVLASPVNCLLFSLPATVDLRPLPGAELFTLERAARGYGEVRPTSQLRRYASVRKLTDGD